MALRMRFLFLSSLLLHGAVVFAVEPILDWGGFDANAPLPTIVGAHISFTGAQPPDLRLVTAETTPSNPFPNSSASLYVTVLEGEPFFRGWSRAFPEGGKAKGSYEFDFRLVEGAVAFTVGQNATPYEEGVSLAYAFLNQGDEYLGANFVVGELVTIRQNKVSTTSTAELSAGVNYRFRVEWDFTSDVPGFRFFLNGDALENVSDNTTFFWPANEAQLKRGVDSFSFSSSTPGIGFFGNIVAGKGD